MGASADRHRDEAVLFSLISLKQWCARRSQEVVRVTFGVEFDLTSQPAAE